LTRTVIGPGGASLGADLRELWAFRDLLGLFVWRDLKIRYKQTVLGALWALIQPLGLMVLFALFFGRLAGMPTDGVPHGVFYYAGLLPWIYAATALTAATGSIVERQFMITKVYFPRVLLPVSGLVPGLVDALVAFGGLLIVMVMSGVPLTPRLLVLPAAMALAALAVLALALWLSMLNAMYRDVRHLLPFLVQMWLFASPVAYPASVVPEAWRWAFALNPMSVVIGSVRWAVAGTAPPAAGEIAATVAIVLVILAGGLAFFRRGEGTVADVV
jgi:lipopolysaccharide transport system permease protein